MNRMMKKKGYKNGGKIKPKGMKNGGKVMTVAQIRSAANKKGYKLVKK